MIDKVSYNEYHRQYNKYLYNERVKLAKELLGNKCNFCGNIENLQIDHIIPIEKEYDIHYATRLSLNKFLEELKKCQLLCNKCHGFKTQVQSGKVINHGSGLSGKRNCKCELCKNKKREYMKSYMRNKRR